jgi:hypothetical protein
MREIMDLCATLARLKPRAAMLSGFLFFASAGCGVSVAGECKGMDPTVEAHYASDNTTINVVIVIPGAATVDEVSQPTIYGATVMSSTYVGGGKVNAAIVPNQGTNGVLIEVSWKCAGQTTAANAEATLALPPMHAAGDNIPATF